MVKYKVEVSASAEKIIKKLPKQTLAKILSVLEGLSVDPRPVGCRKLAGHHLIYRLRVQTYRIIYEIHDDIVLIRILKVGHRKDIYRGL
jgi:mRNA interferase RelE/StbE